MTKKKTLDLRLVVTDAPVGDRPEKIRCREHPDKVRSLAVYPTHLYCYGCGFAIPDARSVRALAYLLGTDEREAWRQRDRYTVEARDAYRDRAAAEARRDPLPAALADIYHRVLCGRRVAAGPEGAWRHERGPREHRLAWLEARGLTRRTIADRAVRLGHDGQRFVIPIFDRELRLIALRYRRDDAYADEDRLPKYMGSKGRNGLYLYPEPLLATLTARDRQLVVCEGELDALRLWQEGIPAVSATNGAGQAYRVPKLLAERYPTVTHLLIATDQDEAGQAAAASTIAEAQKLGLGATRVSWEGAKDVTEYLQSGGSAAIFRPRALACRAA